MNIKAGFQLRYLVKSQDLGPSIQGEYCSYWLGRMMTGLAEEQAESWHLQTLRGADSDPPACRNKGRLQHPSPQLWSDPALQLYPQCPREKKTRDKEQDLEDAGKRSRRDLQLLRGGGRLRGQDKKGRSSQPEGLGESSILLCP